MNRPSAVMPVRTCVGCHGRADKVDLLRVVAGTPSSGTDAVLLAPDPLGRLPGRGAYLHPDPGCLDLAERRRAFRRALRLPGPLDTADLRRWLGEERVPGPSRVAEGAAGPGEETDRDAHGRSMSTQR